MDAAKAADVAHFVWSTLEDTRPVLAGKRAPLQGDYIVPHFDAKHEVEVYAREQVHDGPTPPVTEGSAESLHARCTPPPALPGVSLPPPPPLPAPPPHAPHRSWAPS